MIELLDIQTPSGVEPLDFEAYYARLGELAEGADISRLSDKLTRQIPAYEQSIAFFSGTELSQHVDWESDPYNKLQRLAATSFNIAAGLIVATGGDPNETLQRKHLRNMAKYDPILVQSILAQRLSAAQEQGTELWRMSQADYDSEVLAAMRQAKGNWNSDVDKYYMTSSDFNGAGMPTLDDMQMQIMYWLEGVGRLHASSGLAVLANCQIEEIRELEESLQMGKEMWEVKSEAADIMHFATSLHIELGKSLGQSIRRYAPNFRLYHPAKSRSKRQAA